MRETSLAASYLEFRDDFPGDEWDVTASIILNIDIGVGIPFAHRDTVQINHMEVGRQCT